nr:MAG TPA: hypothetical protein [Caudoviricetes sp.]
MRVEIWDSNLIMVMPYRMGLVHPGVQIII